ncbi:DUF3800 domain-containing protein [Campylobacter sp. RM10532]|uniref:DUF3800 domain-containing protein n=1 Tax=Campylobacter molothri TaxID=1032242 RepID=UPI00301D4404|nr:DUF3800 domain-containing protein [Campylobacter sp. RM10532]
MGDIKEFKIFCDESNHLIYKDNPTLRSKVMVLGALKVQSSEIIRINKVIKYLKHKYNYNKEVKWTKLSLIQKKFYDELLEFFFSSLNMWFQAILIPDKTILQHDIYNQGSHDLFYYKMYYQALRNLIEIDTQIKIYLDYKDTKSGDKMKQLESVLCNKFKKSIDLKIFTIQSHESNIIQLVDLLIGAISYKARDDIEHTSEIKNYIVDKIETLASIELDAGTPPWENKFNIFKIHLDKGKC